MKPVGDLATTPTQEEGYDAFGLDESDGEAAYEEELTDTDTVENAVEESEEAHFAIPSPFEIRENIIYDPPHISPRMRAQDSVLLACYRPLEPLEDREWLEIVIHHDAHDDIRQRLDQYGVFDRQLFPGLDGIAKWLRYRVFDTQGAL